MEIDNLSAFQPLLPAEEKLIQSLQNGQECILPGGERPKNPTIENRIRPSFLKYISVQSGNEFNSHSKGLHLNYAWIEATKDCSERIIDFTGCKILPRYLIENCIIKEHIVLMDAECGVISFEGTKILGSDKDGHSFCADGFHVRKRIYLSNDFECEGTISMPRSRIDGDLHCKLMIPSKIGKSINLEKSKIDGIFHLSCKKKCGEMTMAEANIDTIKIDDKSWFKFDSVRIDGLVYRRIIGPHLSSWNSTDWLKWLNVQPIKHREEGFQVQPYYQLAQYIRRVGHDSDARDILVRMNRMKRQYKVNYPKINGFPTRTAAKIQWHLSIFWDYILDKFVGYGYRSQNVLLLLLPIILIGTIIFELAANLGVIAPTDPIVYHSERIPDHCKINWVESASEKGDVECRRSIPTEYVTFNALIYSIDAAIPVINFGQTSSWSPRSSRPPNGIPDSFGSFVTIWYYTQRSMGWLISLLFVSAVSGIVRK